MKLKQTVHQYSQFNALLAITKASFRAIFANPSALVFSILFPIIFVMIFGAFGSGSGISYRIALEKKVSLTDSFYNALLQIPGVKIVSYSDTTERREDLIKGRLTAIINIDKKTDSADKLHYSIGVRTTTASNNTIYTFLPSLDLVKLKLEKMLSRNSEELVEVKKPLIEVVRKYRAIDFILPGQLGFSILFSTLFGVAFTFFGLREQLVLKRFYATPVKKINILIGIGFSRLAFQILSVTVLLLFGHFAMNFTLHHGVFTFLEIMVMTILMLFFLLGVGLIFSSIVKTDSSIPLLINIFALPQMMLSGTFFPIDVFPKWLQEVCQILPLTQFNNAVRKISFEGLGILDCWSEIGILGVWIIITYFIAVKVLKWE